MKKKGKSAGVNDARETKRKDVCIWNPGDEERAVWLYSGLIGQMCYLKTADGVVGFDDDPDNSGLDYEFNQGDWTDNKEIKHLIKLHGIVSDGTGMTKAAEERLSEVGAYFDYAIEKLIDKCLNEED